MLTSEEIDNYIQHKKLEEDHSDGIDIQIRREHLKRKYLRLHHMERKVSDYKKLKEITKMKRQVLRMIGKEI